MANAMRHVENLRKIFLSGVNAVQPAKLFCADGENIKGNSESSKMFEIRRENEILRVQRDAIVDLTAKRCHLVGFGKAVLGMAVQLESLLGERLMSGILSVPVGTALRFHNIADMNLRQNSVIKVYEGAVNNLPDVAACVTAQKIHDLASSMTQDDVLFVLVSGGGSALLPMPTPPITLEEKFTIIRDLASRAAGIRELNQVRIAMSAIKGGKLAYAARNAHKVISFVISDIIGDPLELIASGPTVCLDGERMEDDAETILKEYTLWGGISQQTKRVIRKSGKVPKTDNSSIYVVGSNKIATEACAETAKSLNYLPCILSTSIEGNVETLSGQYANLLSQFRRLLSKEIDRTEFFQTYPFDVDVFQGFLREFDGNLMNKDLCFILAGEPTVRVRGNGVGGRNQELSLRLSLELHRQKLTDIYFLSAGTDGIDGLSPAAGAIGCSALVDTFLQSNNWQTLLDYLNNNDSYNFYRNFKDNRYLINTGHTGTNVMDLHLIIIPKL